MRTAALILMISVSIVAQASEPVTIFSAEEWGGQASLSRAAREPVVVPNPDGNGGSVFRLDYAIGEGDGRAYWDFPVDLDLSRYGRFEVDLSLPGSEDIDYATIYFGSDSGWTGAPLPGLGPRPGATWRTHSWQRADMWQEDMGPWTSVSAIRVSLWANEPCEGSAYVRSIRAYADPIAVILPEWMQANLPSEAEAAAQEAERATSRLREAGLQARQVADTEIAAGALEGVRVAICAHIPEIDPAAQEALTAFVEEGGALLVFYSGPDWLYRLVGVTRMTYLRPEEGSLDRIRLDDGAWIGAPAEVLQESWNAHIPAGLRADAQVRGQWVSRSGQETGPAVVLTDTGAFVGHILTGADSAAKSRFLLSLVAHFEPSAWSEAYDSARTSVAAVGPYETIDELSAVVADSGSNEAEMSLNEGLQALADAEEARAAGDFPTACLLANSARRPLAESYAYSVPPRQDEFRAVWCHSAFGVVGMSWDEAIEHLAASGFTAILPNMSWGGLAYYPSEVLPVYAEIDERGDQIAECLAAAKRHGVEVHVWKVNWYLGRTTEEWTEAARREGRLQIDANGEEFNWLCPSSDVNSQIEIDAMLEVVRNYDVDGIHFDYIRYPGTEGCYCPRCQERFEAWVGHRVDDWPTAVFDSDGPDRAAYFDFRRAQIDRVVQAVAEGAKAIRPTVEVSAAVFSEWPSTRDSVGQDWVRWIDEGWLDFVCPMDYLTDSDQFSKLVRKQAEWVGGRIPMYPGIGAHSLAADDVLYQVTLLRPYAPGFTVFNYDTTLARDHLPLLAKGATSQ